jgi:hypothetical protein
MARKAKRRQQARKRPAAAPAPSAAARPPVPPRSGAEATVRSVELSLAPKAPVRGKGPRVLIEDSDPGIPLAQVPYFTRDLARLGIVAGSMVVLLLVGAQLIPLIVH